MASAPSDKLCLVASTARCTLPRTLTTSASLRSAMRAIRSSTSASKFLISLEAAALISLTPSLKSFFKRRPLARKCSPSTVLSICYLLSNTRNNISGIVLAAAAPRHRLHTSRPVGIASHAKLYTLKHGNHMKILGEELGKIGRWYIAVPPLLLIGFLVGLFFLAAAGQSRLNAANERVHASQLRQQALSEFIALIDDAESGQRGYLLTGESSYLQPYTEAVATVEAELDRVRAAYGNSDNRELEELRILTGKKLGELEDTLAL